MPNLIPLRDIPARARPAESAARRRYQTRAAALDAATWRLVSAPGCHSRPADDPPVVGWTLTRAAAESVAERVIRMPGGTSHHDLRAEQYA